MVYRHFQKEIKTIKYYELIKLWGHLELRIYKARALGITMSKNPYRTIKHKCRDLINEINKRKRELFSDTDNTDNELLLIELKK